MKPFILGSMLAPPSAKDHCLSFSNLAGHSLTTSALGEIPFKHSVEFKITF